MRRGKPIGRNINFEPTTGRVGLKKLKSLENSTTRFHEIEDRRSKPFFSTLHEFQVAHFFSNKK